ncbi:hypothetical protein D9757_007555 [Collybiopsis confluens]|uniref:Uncharacterized protein n=1 Tax=Collybiopsis confluens TaxID=2823264 RepID=A0A8H5HEN7_9AGAR|nr:hypothetical protein D9757_007555 [Collybiopsis confluens]
MYVAHFSVYQFVGIYLDIRNVAPNWRFWGQTTAALDVLLDPSRRFPYRGKSLNSQLASFVFVRCFLCCRSTIHEILRRKDKSTVRSLSLVESSFTAFCQRNLLSRLTISCPSADSTRHFHHRRSSSATHELLPSSSHLIPYVRSLWILDADIAWGELDIVLVQLLGSPIKVTSFAWQSKSICSEPTYWKELPLPLQDAIGSSSNALYFPDLTALLDTRMTLSPSLASLNFRGKGRSTITCRPAWPSISSCDDIGGAVVMPPKLFITACKLEGIEDTDLFFRGISAIQPNLSLERLDELAVLEHVLPAPVAASDDMIMINSSLNSSFLGVPATHITRFIQIWRNWHPAGQGWLVHLHELPSLQRLGLCADTIDVDNAWNIVSAVAEIFEVSQANNHGITHIALLESEHLDPLNEP